MIHATLAYALVFGSFSACLLFSSSGVIGTRWLHDLRTVAPLRLFAFSLPAIALSSCFAGYFVAVRRVFLSAPVQIAEEILRVLLTIALLRRTVGTEQALIALALSGLIADLISATALGALFLHDRRRLPTTSAALPLADNSLASVNHRLLSITLPVAFSAYARSGLITLEHLLIPIGLKSYGMAHADALASYGTLHSMAVPLLLFPSAIIASFGGLLVPELTEAMVRGETKRIRHMVGLSLSLSLIFAVGCSAVMFGFSRELGMLFYRSESAGTYIRALAPLVPVMYLDGATDAALKGLGEQLYSMKVNILDALLSVVLVRLLLPTLGIDGYVITIYITELLNAILSIFRLFRVTHLRLDTIRILFKPFVCAVGAACLTRILLVALPTLPTVHLLVAGAGCLFLLYGLLLFAVGVFNGKNVRRAWKFCTS